MPVDEAHAGDIVAIAGFQSATVADTLCDKSVDKPIDAQPIDPPTLAMTFSINDSPLAGTEGDKVTSRVIWDRLTHEAEGNVALQVRRTDDLNAFEVAGQGELQLAVLIETMRREGFELSISRPRVVYQEDPETQQRLEPIEEVVIDVDEEHSGTVVEKLSARKGAYRNAFRWCGQTTSRLSPPVSLPHWLSWRIYDRHTGHRRYEPAISRLCTL